MKAIRFVFCLFAALMLTTLNGLAAEEEDFKTFLQKFTSSASFQYSRIKFPSALLGFPLECVQYNAWNSFSYITLFAAYILFVPNQVSFEVSHRPLEG